MCCVWVSVKKSTRFDSQASALNENDRFRTLGSILMPSFITSTHHLPNDNAINSDPHILTLTILTHEYQQERQRGIGTGSITILYIRMYRGLGQSTQAVHQGRVLPARSKSTCTSSIIEPDRHYAQCWICLEALASYFYTYGKNLGSRIQALKYYRIEYCFCDTSITNDEPESNWHHNEQLHNWSAASYGLKPVKIGVENKFNIGVFSWCVANSTHFFRAPINFCDSEKAGVFAKLPTYLRLSVVA